MPPPQWGGILLHCVNTFVSPHPYRASQAGSYPQEPDRRLQRMAHDWIIAQLDAMTAYADANNLPALAQALRDAKLLALTEIASSDSDQTPQTPSRH
jgi:hypothetical protein